MKKLRLTIYILFFAFNISLLIFSLVIEQIDVFELAGWILPKISYMKYGAMLGVLLVAVDFIVDKVEKATLSKEVEKTQNELNAVKAQLFDMQQKSSSAPAEAPVSSPETSESKPEEGGE